MLELCHCPLCGVPHMPANHWCVCCSPGPCEHRMALGRMELLSEHWRQQIEARGLRGGPDAG